MIKTRSCGRNKPLFRTCKQSELVQSHANTTLGVNVKIRSDIAVAIANAVASLGVNGPIGAVRGESCTVRSKLNKLEHVGGGGELYNEIQGKRGSPPPVNRHRQD